VQPTTDPAPRPAPPNNREVPFDDLLRGVRAGDGSAAEELVRRFGKPVQEAVRGFLSDPRLRRVVDPTDICQWVFTTFFTLASAGRFDLVCREQVLGLLVGLGRNRVRSCIRAAQAARRDNRRIDPGGAAVLESLPVRGVALPEAAANRELVVMALGQLSAVDRRVLEMRVAGWGWAEVAAALGASANSLRKRLNRATGRLRECLAWDRS